MCYNNKNLFSDEVTVMDEQLNNSPEEIPEEETQAEETPAYVPRPMWQVWMARVALVLFIALIIMYYINMMRGG